MSFPTLHPENKTLNLLDSVLTLYPNVRPELRDWVKQLTGAIARPVPAPDALRDLSGERPEGDEIDMQREAYLLARALCEYRERVYPEGLADPFDPDDAARDDLDSAINRLEERLFRSKPRVELENAPDAGDYYEGGDPDPTDQVDLDPNDPGDPSVDEDEADGDESAGDRADRR